MVKGISAKWGTCSRTATLDVNPQALSYRNNTIAVGLELESDNIIILDAITGTQAAVLSSHSDWVRSLVFSLDGRLLVSGSDDETVKLWDMQTGGVIKTFHGHTHWVLSVSISTDCTRIVSGGNDCTILLWDIQIGECHHSIKLHGWVKYVGFSPTNPKCLLSISGDQVQQWDINGYQTEPAYDGSNIAFSSDQVKFALCNGSTIIVKSSNSGAVTAELNLPNDNPAQCCCFSPDGSLIAVSSNNIVYAWDIANPVPHIVATFVGHVYNITSLVFSSPSSLISASEDRSVKFWKIEILPRDQASPDPKPTLPASASIQFVSLQAKEGIAISGDSNGMLKVWDIITGLCKASFQTPARQIFWGDAQLKDGKLLFVWHVHWDGKIHTWTSEHGEYSQTLDSLQSSGLRISGDGSKIFNVNWCHSNSRIQAWSLWTWEPLGEVELEAGETYLLDPFISHGSKVWVYSTDLRVKGWNFENLGFSPIPLSCSSAERPYLDIIHDARGSTTIRNTVTGKEVFKTSGKYAKPTVRQWDGQYLVAGYEDGEVLILDFKPLCFR